MIQGFLQIAIFCALIVAVVPLLGGHMARVFRGERTFIDPVAAPMERITYRLLRIDPERGQDDADEVRAAHTRSSPSMSATRTAKTPTARAMAIRSMQS